MLSFCFAMQEEVMQPNASVNYIQNEHHKFVMLANNILAGEVISATEDSDGNSSLNNQPFLTISLINNYKTDKNSQINWGFIHNLSTDKQKVHQIRAP